MECSGSIGFVFMAKPKNINLLLMDGEADGRIKCTLANWTGMAYKIPRTLLDACRERADLKQAGVYFLFGTSEETGEPVVYIGQAGTRKNGEGILSRLQEHRRNPEKDYWTEAVVFTTSNNSLGPTEISYLENRFASLAKAARRYEVKNENDPNPGHVTEEKECEMEEFIEQARLMMGTLGHKVFEPVSEEAPADVAEQDMILLFGKGSQAEAKGTLTPEGFVVFAGSKVRPDTTVSCSAYVKSLREKWKEKIGPDGCLTEDLLFTSPSAASGFLTGTSINGNEFWKTKDGIRLGTLQP